MTHPIRLIASTARIRQPFLEEAYQRLCGLDASHDYLKQEVLGPDGSSTWAFAGMSPNYSETCKDTADILRELGFELVETPLELRLMGFNREKGQELTFIKVIADLMQGEMTWQGVSGHLWKWSFFESKRRPKLAKLAYA